jgi:hypothetical protein
VPFADPHRKKQYNDFYYQKNRNQILLRKNKADRVRRREVREKVIKYYSHGLMACLCCGEDMEMFLTIDHLKNNGNAHKRTFSGELYVWLVKHNFPRGFQVLCMNCNLGKAKNGGKCPHKD